MLFVSVLALGAGASLVACGGLFGIIACEGDDTCPSDLVCVAERCVAPGPAAEGEGEGEGEGEAPVLLTSTFRVDPCLADVTGSLAPASTLEFNGDTGAIVSDGVEVRAAGAGVAGGIGFARVTQVDGPEIGMFSTAGLSLGSAATVTMAGTVPVGLAVCGDVDLAGVVELSGRGFPGGAGDSGAGGVEGGGALMGGSQGVSDPSEFTGGGGGGNIDDGGRGSSTQFQGSRVDGGNTGGDSLLPLRFPGSGGGGGALTTDPRAGGAGGASGGSLYLYVSGALGCSTGSLQSRGLRGVDGGAGGEFGGGGGGGAGGSIFLEGTSVAIGADCLVDTRGGAGGGSSTGQDGGLGGFAADGFSCGGLDGVDGAGGGGACGRVRIRGRVLSLTEAAFISPFLVPDTSGVEVVDVP